VPENYLGLDIWLLNFAFLGYKAGTERRNLGFWYPNSPKLKRITEGALLFVMLERLWKNWRTLQDQM